MQKEDGKAELVGNHLAGLPLAKEKRFQKKGHGRIELVGNQVEGLPLAKDIR